jgi:hypothetical protein
LALRQKTEYRQRGREFFFNLIPQPLNRNGTIESEKEGDADDAVKEGCNVFQIYILSIKFPRDIHLRHGNSS